MRIAVVDDDRNVVDSLLEYMKKYQEDFQMNMEGVAYDDGIDFLEHYNMQFDVICMDIELPIMNGIEVARKLRTLDENVVLMFITNNTNYALQAYEVDAIDYVLKPIGYLDFVQKMQKAIRFATFGQKERKLGLNCKEGFISLQLSEVYYVEVMKHYLIYHSEKGDYKVRGTLLEAEHRLKPEFMRCNKSFLINMKHVNSIGHNTLDVAGITIPISRGRKKEFLQAYASMTHTFHA